jgi:uncharacterized membrane protein YjgN (DUF898 family)
MGEAETGRYQEAPFEFTGRAIEYFGIWIVNILLTVITFGIYGAWAKVRTHRYFYGHTRVAGAAFDYPADPVAILKGWLIAIGFFMIYNVIVGLFPLMLFPFLLCFILIVPWVVIRAMMFRMRYTTYRNIRFSFHKNYPQAIRVLIGLGMLIPLTLGLVYPYYVFARKRFFIDNSGFGNTRFRFGGRPGEFYAIYVKVLLIMLALGAIVTVAVMPLMQQTFGELKAIGDMPQDAPPGKDAVKAILTAEFLIMGIFAGVYLLAYGYIQARVNNLVYNRTELDGHRFRSTLRARDLLWLYLSNLIAIVLSFGLLIPWTRVRLARYRAARLVLLAAGDLDSFTQAQLPKQGAMGEEIGEVFDIDIGL